MYSYISPEDRVRRDHPLRSIRAMTDGALSAMSGRFEAMYAKTGRPSNPIWLLTVRNLLKKCRGKTGKAAQKGGN